MAAKERRCDTRMALRHANGREMRTDADRCGQMRTRRGLADQACTREIWTDADRFGHRCGQMRTNTDRYGHIRTDTDQAWPWKGGLLAAGRGLPPASSSSSPLPPTRPPGHERGYE
eukprot:3935707-Rhodomonas_salina.2